MATALSRRVGLYCVEQRGQPFSLKIEILQLDKSLSRFMPRTAKLNMFLGMACFNSYNTESRFPRVLISKTVCENRKSSNDRPPKTISIFLVLLFSL